MRYAPARKTFQSTPPRRGRLVALVSIHAPAKGATASRCFNPRPREGGDMLAWARALLRSSFNPRPREGGDPMAIMWRYQREHGFNPRPREGGDVRSGDQLGNPYVSIHAPAKGATSTLYLIVKQQKIPLFARTTAVCRSVDGGSVEFTRLQPEKLELAGCANHPEDQPALVVRANCVSTTADHRGHRIPWCLRALSWSASSRRGGRNADCPWPHRSLRSTETGVLSIERDLPDIQIQSIGRAARNLCISAQCDGVSVSLLAPR